MLTKVEVGQFKAFGYVILRGCLRPDEVRALQEAFDRGIESAPDFDAFGTGGSKRLAPFVEGGVLAHERNRLRLTRDGMLLASEVMRVFV